MKNLSKISLRKANLSDIEFLWYLRNQSYVYKYSRVNRAVSWKEHVNWVFPILLKQNNKEIFIIYISEVPIGQVRFDYKNSQEAKISISILKKFQKRGFAAKSLNLAIKQIEKTKNLKLLKAEIHYNNTSSRKLFEKLNFKLKKNDHNIKKWLKYTRIL